MSDFFICEVLEKEKWLVDSLLPRSTLLKRAILLRLGEGLFGLAICLRRQEFLRFLSQSLLHNPVFGKARPRPTE